MENEVTVTASTTGPDGSRRITLDPISTHKMQVEARRVESTIGTGFRQHWLSGSSGEGVDRHDAVEFEVDCGAGVGSPWLSLTVTMPDGSTRAEVIDIRPLVQTWVSKVVADGPTGPWWLGQYPVGTKVDMHGDSAWLPGEVIECDDKGIRIAYQHDAKDGPFTMWVLGTEIALQVRRRG